MFLFFTCLYSRIIFLCIVILILLLGIGLFSGLGFLTYGIELDSLGILLLLLLAWFSILVRFLSLKYKKFKKNIFLFVSLLLMCVLWFSCGVSSFVGFYIFFEVSLVPLFFLIAGWGYQMERIQAGFYLFTYTVVGSLPLLLVFLWFCSLDLFFWSNIVLKFSSIRDLFIMLIFVFIFMGFLIKLPLYRVHVWLPKAHVEAPVLGSMVLAAVLLKLRLYGVYRCLFVFKCLINLTNFFIMLVIWGGVLRGLVAIRQSDIKSLVAYSSVGHISFIIGGILLISNISVWRVIVLIIAHGFCSSALFYMVNNLYEQQGSRQVLIYSGEFAKSVLRYWWFLFVCINFSAPPFMGFFGELNIIAIILLYSYFILTFILISSFLSAVFRVYIFRSVVHGKTTVSKISIVSSESNSVCLVYHIFPAIFLGIILDIFYL